MGALLCAFLAVAGQTPQATPIALADVLSDLGKQRIVVQNCINRWGTITDGQCTVGVTFTVERKAPATVSGVYFSGRFATPKRPSQSQVAAWLAIRRGRPPQLGLA